MIKEIVWDLGNVLLAFDKSLWIDLSLKNKSQDLKFGQNSERKLEIGLITNYNFYLELKKEYNFTESFDQFEEAFSNIFKPIQKSIDIFLSIKNYIKVK